MGVTKPLIILHYTHIYTLTPTKKLCGRVLSYKQHPQSPSSRSAPSCRPSRRVSSATFLCPRRDRYPGVIGSSTSMILLAERQAFKNASTEEFDKGKCASTSLYRNGSGSAMNTSWYFGFRSRVTPTIRRYPIASPSCFTRSTAIGGISPTSRLYPVTSKQHSARVASSMASLLKAMVAGGGATTKRRSTPLASDDAP